MNRTSTRNIFSAMCTVTTVTVLLVFAQPAGAAGKSTNFCGDIESIHTVLAPTMPSSDSLSAIASAVSKLPNDVTALKKIHSKLIAAAAEAPSPALARVLRIAATSVVKEISAVITVMSDEANVISDPRSSPAVLAMARDLIAAFSAAATANAYLAVDEPLIVAACKSSS
jgi:hypothetical protein